MSTASSFPCRLYVRCSSCFQRVALLQIPLGEHLHARFTAGGTHALHETLRELIEGHLSRIECASQSGELIGQRGKQDALEASDGSRRVAVGGQLRQQNVEFTVQVRGAAR